MTATKSRKTALIFAVAAAWVCSEPLSGQTQRMLPDTALGTNTAQRTDSTSAAPTVIYEREVFEYVAAGRPDPFRSLLLEGQLGVRPEDLTLRGIIYNSDPSRSIATLSVAGSERRVQLHVGERLGSIRLLSIGTDRVEIVVEELGVSRRETLILRPQTGATQ